MKKTIEGELFHEVEVLGNNTYTHLGFRDKKNKFGDMLASLVPEIGTTRKVRLTFEVLGDIEKTKSKKIDLKSFFKKNNVFAVVGVSRNLKKYGNKVFNDLISNGYRTYAINPHIDSLKGYKVYSSLEKLPEKVDVVVFVVPPKITFEMLKQVKKLRIKNVWMQPGSESQKAIQFCENNNINIIVNQCIIVNKSK